MVTVSNNDYEDKAYVLFKDGYGLDKISHQNAKVPMVYFPVDGVNYSIAMLDSRTMEIPLSFEAKTMGEYTIAIDFDTEIVDNVYLVDNMTGSVTNMSTSDYTFVATTNDSPNRFVVRMSDINSLDEHYGNNDVFAHIENGKLIVDNISDNAMLDIYDVMGRRIACDIVKNAESYSLDVNNVKSGMYIIRLSDKEGIRVQKIIL